MISRCVYLLMTVCMLSACGGSGKLDSAVYEVASAINENDPDRLDQFRLTEAAGKDLFDKLLEINPLLKNVADFDEFWAEFGDKEREWDIPKKVAWDYMEKRIKDGVKVDVDNLKYDVVKDEDRPWQMVVFIETTHDQHKWLMCKFVNLDGGYFIDDPIYLDITSEKETAEELFSDSQ